MAVITHGSKSYKNMNFRVVLLYFRLKVTATYIKNKAITDSTTNIFFSSAGKFEFTKKGTMHAQQVLNCNGKVCFDVIQLTAFSNFHTKYSPRYLQIFFCGLPEIKCSVVDQ